MKAALGQASEADGEKKTSPTSEAGVSLRKLQDEINTLTKKNCGVFDLFTHLPL